MKFVEFQGVVLNLEQIKVAQKAIDKTKLRKMTNPEDGTVEEVVDGKPFLVTLDMGDATAVNFTYATREERDQNYLRLLDVLQVPQI